MLFKPKFCCCCGEKIERIDWGLWASRRFCEICETEHVLTDWAPTLLVAAALLTGMFGTAALLRGGAPQEKAVLSGPSREVSTSLQESTDPQVIEARESNRAEKEKSAFSCGALTKKGTRCSRRVSARGERCWQHRDRQ